MGAAIAVLLAALAAFPAMGQAPLESPPAPAYATGDAWIDGRLADIDAYAARFPDAFVAEIERHAGVARAYTRTLQQQPGWRAGDVWYACFLARAVDTSCRGMVRARSLDNVREGASWARVGEAFGADDATRAGVRLALADSYRRWARPLQPDAALARVLRQREKRDKTEPAAR